jgi:hypothetical protein
MVVVGRLDVGLVVVGLADVGFEVGMRVGLIVVEFDVEDNTLIVTA